MKTNSIKEERQIQYWDSRCKDTGGIKGCPSPEAIEQWIKKNPNKSSTEMWWEFVEPAVNKFLQEGEAQ